MSRKPKKGRGPKWWKFQRRGILVVIGETNKRAWYLEQFFKRVEKANAEKECWLWTGSMDAAGYGLFSQRDGKNLWSFGSAHRVAWQLANGPITDGQWVLHKCDIRHCVRPDHLYLGTPADNTRDMIERGHAAWQAPEVS